MCTVVYLGAQTYSFKDELGELFDYHFTSKEAYISKRINHYCETNGFYKYLSTPPEDPLQTKNQDGEKANPYLGIVQQIEAATKKCKNEVKTYDYPTEDSIKYSYIKIAKELVVPPIMVTIAIILFVWLLFNVLRWIRLGFKD